MLHPPLSERQRCCQSPHQSWTEIQQISSCSYWPPRNDADNIACLDLEDDFQRSSCECPPDQLKTISELFIPSNRVITEKTLDRFFEAHTVFRKLVTFKVVFEITGFEAMPINQSPPLPLLFKILIFYLATPQN